MKKGEIWADKDDGTKVKIIDIQYNSTKTFKGYELSDYFVTLEELDKNCGFVKPSKFFLKQYEKCYGE